RGALDFNAFNLRGIGNAGVLHGLAYRVSHEVHLDHGPVFFRLKLAGVGDADREAFALARRSTRLLDEQINVRRHDTTDTADHHHGNCVEYLLARNSEAFREQHFHRERRIATRIGIAFGLLHDRHDVFWIDLFAVEQRDDLRYVARRAHRHANHVGFKHPTG